MNVSSRKRTRSFSNSTSSSGSNNKRRKKSIFTYKRGIVPPTKFLLGGNIRDPLNLYGLQNEEEIPDGTNKTDNKNEKADKALPTLKEFLLGGSINDPLNLNGIRDDISEGEPSERHAEECINSKSNADCTNGNNNSSGVSEEKQPPVHHQLAPPEHVQVTECKKSEKKDKIVSPVIPQPYRPLKTLHYKPTIITPNVEMEQKTPKFKEKNSRFQYGNYNRYYGYRNMRNGVDLRLEIFANHKHFFTGKDVLDIGCNIGHIALIVARDFNAKSVTGIDIDRSLINVARKNIKYYINCTSPYAQNTPPQCSGTPHSREQTSDKKVDLKNKCYPVSMPITYGPVVENNLKKELTFPKNVSFVHGNYVLENDALIQIEQPQFDTVLCLSITKWLHLNWGDAGLKRAFKRMFAQLRPGGVLIVEPQSWDSYTKKKNLTETIWKHYHEIHLFPHHFDSYLLSEVGFSRCQTIAVVNHQEKGFRRSIKVFTKPVPNDKTDNIAAMDDNAVDSSEASNIIMIPSDNTLSSDKNMDVSRGTDHRPDAIESESCSSSTIELPRMESLLVNTEDIVDISQELHRVNEETIPEPMH